MADGKSLFICFDRQRYRFLARRFLKELAEQGVPLRLHGASKAVDAIDWQRETVLTDRMRGADVVIVLVGPMTSMMQEVEEEVAAANRLSCKVIGVYVDGAVPSTNLPKGLDKSQMVGWDWGTIVKRLT